MNRLHIILYVFLSITVIPAYGLTVILRFSYNVYMALIIAIVVNAAMLYAMYVSSKYFYSRTKILGKLYSIPVATALSLSFLIFYLAGLKAGAGWLTILGLPFYWIIAVIPIFYFTVAVHILILIYDFIQKRYRARYGGVASP